MSELGDVVLARVRPDVVQRYLARFKISTAGDTAAQVARLTAHQLAQPEDLLVACDVCNGVSSGELDECPYCGSDENEQQEETTMASKKTTTKPTPKVAAKKAPAKESKARAAKTVLEERGAKLTRAMPTEVQTVKQLDREVAAIRKAQEAGAASLYEVGVRLAKIEEQGLYTLRLDESKKPLYRSMEQFCDVELGIGKKYAQRLADVSRRFTPDDAKQIGVTKLYILASIKPGEEFDHLIEQARGGATRQEIEQEVKRLQPEREAPKREGWKGDSQNRATRAPRESAPTPPPEESGKITTIVTDEEVKLRLVEVEDDDGRKVLEAVEQSANGVETVYQVEQVDKKFFLTVTRQRA